MFSLILVTTFTPFLWGESKVSAVEIKGLSTYSQCQEQADKFKSYKDNQGTTIFHSTCVSKGETK